MREETIRDAAPGQKTACVVRYGAWGDAVLMSPVLEALKVEGYHVTVNCTERCFEILRADPNVDAFLHQETNEIHPDRLNHHWEKLKKRFDRFINLSGSIETALLMGPNQDEYYWSTVDRHKKCNVNYMDYTMYRAGFSDKLGLLPKIYFREKEENWCRDLKTKNPGYLVAVSMTGSSVHKIYPYMGDVINAILLGIPNSRVVLLGEAGAKGIMDPHERITDLCGEIGIRKSFCLTKHANLVISTETSIANASSCFETPKVIILSHSSEENLTKYWKNCISVSQRVSCSPCHMLHYTKKTCRLDKELELPICQSLLSPKKVINAVEKHYQDYLQKEKVKAA